VPPSTISFTKPTGAGLMENWPCASVWAVTADATALAFEVNTLVSIARRVTPGMATLLLSSTTPVMVVFAGLPGARPEAVKVAGKLWFAGKVAVTTLLALPSCNPSVNVAAARPSESVFTV
jgi:hypothetical protein